MEAKKIEVGDIFSTNAGGEVEVVEYRGALEVVVKHLDKWGHEDVVQTDLLRKGVVKNPYKPSVFGKGFMGVGKYRASSAPSRQSPAYKAWVGLIRRTYEPSYLSSGRNIYGSTVCEEWHNFQNFAEWFYNEPNSDNPEFRLDKGMRVWGGRLYSPETCSYVPKCFHVWMTTKPRVSRELPRGVHPSGAKYLVMLNGDGRNNYLGTFETVAEAQEVYEYNLHKKYRQLAIEHCDEIHPEVYDNLMEFSS